VRIKTLGRISSVISAIIIIVAGLSVPAMASNAATISISSLDMAKSIKEFPLANGTWTISPWEKGIGHLEKTGWFDNPTNIVLAGHSVMPNGDPGIFANLNLLSAGQEIVLSDGSENRRYQITDIRIVPVDDVSVVMPTEQERLTLITCETGSYDEVSQSYSQRLVVVADRVN
jgi:LPXTG-site transpeptidase (sortase) family protein